MITENDMYWLTRLDGIKALLGTLSGVSIVLSALLGFHAFALWVDTEPDEDDSTRLKISKALQRKWGIRLFSVLPLTVLLALLLAIGNTLTPTTREMCAIKVVPMIANNEDLKGLGGDVVELAREWVKELKPKTNSKPEAEK